MPEPKDYLAEAKVDMAVASKAQPRSVFEESIKRAQVEALIAIAEQMEKQTTYLGYIYDRLTSMQRFMK